MSGLPVVNRLLKVSDSGYRESQRNSEVLDVQAKARLRVQYDAAATALVSQHDWLQKLGDKRTPEQNQRYYRIHAWKTGLYDRADEAAWNLSQSKQSPADAIRAINTSAKQLTEQLKGLKAY